MSNTSAENSTASGSGSYQDTVFKYTVWEPKLVSVKTPRDGKNNTQNSSLSCNNKPFTVITPRSTIPFNIQQFTSKNNAQGTSETQDSAAAAANNNTNKAVKLNVSIKVDDPMFKSKLDDFDRHVVECINTQSNLRDPQNPKKSAFVKLQGCKREWTNVTEEFYGSSCKTAKDETKSYPPTFSPALKIVENKDKTAEDAYILQTKVYDQHGVEITNITVNPLKKDDPNYISNVIKANDQCVMLVDSYIWSNTTGMGTKWQIVQIRVYPNNSGIPSNVCIIGDDDDTNTIENSPTGNTKNNGTNNNNNKSFEKSDPNFENESSDTEEVTDGVELND
jgi:hypothetical protein